MDIASNSRGAVTLSLIIHSPEEEDSCGKTEASDKSAGGATLDEKR